MSYPPRYGSAMVRSGGAEHTDPNAHQRVDRTGKWMTLEALLIITVVVAAFGTLSTQLFRSTGSPFLLTISGTKGQLIVAGALIWIAAIAIGLLSLIVVSAFMSSMVALAIFFGIEAVALDLCANRTQYQRVESQHPGPIRVTTLNRS